MTALVSTCQECGKSFLHDSGGPIRKFCSPECAKKNYSDRRKASYVPKSAVPERVCVICGKLFTPGNNQRNAVACSKECNHKRQANKKKAQWAEARQQSLICPICGKEFVRGLRAQKYCSEECREKAEELARLDNRHRSKWGGAWLEAMERDNHACQMCGNKDHLVVHHLDGNGERSALRNGQKHNTDAGNLLVLCDSCHKLFHSIFLLKKDGQWVLSGEVFDKLGLTPIIHRTA